MASKAKLALLVAVSSFVCAVDDRDVFVRQGDTFPASDPIVKGREELFAPAPAASG